MVLIITVVRQIPKQETRSVQTQGRDADVFDRSVDIQVSRLRGVLKDTGTSKIIKTVRGGGYMLSVDVEHDA